MIRSSVRGAIHKSMETEMQNGDARELIERISSQLEPADAAHGRAEWRLTTTGDEAAQAEMAEARARWMRLFADDEIWERVRSLRG
jgi:hypothetical protein